MDDLGQESLWKLSDDQIKEEMLQVRDEHTSPEDDTLELIHDDFIVDHCDVHYGSKENNLIANMRFLEKSKLS